MPVRGEATQARPGEVDLGGKAVEATARTSAAGGRDGSLGRRVATLEMRELIGLEMPVDPQACRHARLAVSRSLRPHVTADSLECALLLISEMVGNAVRHSGAGAHDTVVIRVSLNAADARVEVEDPGGGGDVEVRTPDLDGGGGFGLNLVQMLSRRWAVERLSGGRTRVWADVARATRDPLTSPFAPMHVEKPVPEPSLTATARTTETETEMTPKNSAAPTAVPVRDGHDAKGNAQGKPQGELKGSASRPRKRGRANLERAHKTVTGTAEALPGAPRSGSA